MKIKVGKKIYDSENEPIMVILTEKDKENIFNMFPTATKYCCYPDNLTEEEIRKFMKT